MNTNVRIFVLILFAVALINCVLRLGTTNVYMNPADVTPALDAGAL